MVKSKYEDDENLANRAYARFYASDSPSISSEQFPSGVFYYRNVNGLEDYQSYHEQSTGRAGNGHTNDFTGNQVAWTNRSTRITRIDFQYGIMFLKILLIFSPFCLFLCTSLPAH